VAQWIAAVRLWLREYMGYVFDPWGIPYIQTLSFCVFIYAVFYLFYNTDLCHLTLFLRVLICYE